MKLPQQHFKFFPRKDCIVGLLSALTLIAPAVTNAQTAPTLTIAEPFVFYTTGGAITNVGATEVTGYVGTAVGAMGGFTTTTPPGGGTATQIHEQSTLAVNASSEVCAAYSNLAAQTCTNTIGDPILSGTTILPGVSCVLGQAASLATNGTLTLNGDANAIFVIQIGGAFNMATGSQILLMGGAKIENVFFQIDGALNINAGAIFRGTAITQGGDITLGNNAQLYGRALACAGAITLDDNTAMSAQAAVLPIVLSEFKASKQNNKTLIQWTTESEINTKHFIIEHSVTGQGNSWTSKGRVNASGYSATQKHYTLTDNNPSVGANFYRLKSVDNDNSFSLSQSDYVHFSKISASTINAFPMPFNDVINLKGIEKGSTIILSDLSGKTIRQVTATGAGNERINSSNLTAGSYFIKVISVSGETTSLKINKQ